MKSFSLLRVLALCGLCMAPYCPAWGHALSAAMRLNFLRFSKQGYLGVDVSEVDSERAAALHLKDTHGAEVTMIDHDAPAGKSGFKVHDVILQLNGRSFATAKELRHRLDELPAGRVITFLVSRDGNRSSMIVELCDRSKLQQEAWHKHYIVPAPTPLPVSSPAMSFLGKAPTAAPGFLVDALPSTFHVGAEVNPVRSQLADYFGVRSGTGLLVENVDSQSPAARAGMKAGDVIVQVESQSMRTRSDWLKAIHKHRGEQVRVTVMRNKQELILILAAGKPKKS